MVCVFRVLCNLRQKEIAVYYWCWYMTDACEVNSETGIRLIWSYTERVLSKDVLNNFSKIHRQKSLPESLF